MKTKWHWWDRFRRPTATLYTYAQIGEYPLDYPAHCKQLRLTPVRVQLTGYNMSVLNVWWKGPRGELVLVVHSTGR